MSKRPTYLLQPTAQVIQERGNRIAKENFHPIHKPAPEHRDELESPQPGSNLWTSWSLEKSKPRWADHQPPQHSDHSPPSPAPFPNPPHRPLGVIGRLSTNRSASGTKGTWNWRWRRVIEIWRAMEIVGVAVGVGMFVASTGVEFVYVRAGAGVGVFGCGDRVGVRWGGEWGGVKKGGSSFSDTWFSASLRLVGDCWCASSQTGNSVRDEIPICAWVCFGTKTGGRSGGSSVSKTCRIGDRAPGVVFDRRRGLGLNDVLDAAWVREGCVGVEGNKENREGDLTWEGDVARLAYFGSASWFD